MHLNLERAKHFGRQFISDNQRFTAEMLRPYEHICKNGMLPLGVTAFNTLIYIAGHTTQALNMALIATSSPIFIVLMSRFFLRRTYLVNTGCRYDGCG